MVRQNNKTLGFYLPSFFTLHVGINNSIENLKELSNSDFSIFFHEYVHFIQDISTYYGLFNMDSVCNSMRYANNKILNDGYTRFKVPVEPDVSNADNLLLKSLLINLTYGDVSSCSVDKILTCDISNQELDIANAAVKNIEVVTIEFIDKQGEENMYSFGAGCIMESMAYLLEQFSCPEYSKSPDFPYNAAEIVVNFIYPDFGLNKLNILALCDLSLNISNPANFFIQTLMSWKESGEVPEEPEVLYKEFYKNNFSLNGSPYENFEHQYSILLVNTINEISKYFNMSYFDSLEEWVKNTIVAATLFRKRSPYFILNLAKSEARSNPEFISFFNAVGSPLMTNDNGEVRFYHTDANSKNIDISNFWAISQIQNLFLGKVGPCQLLKFCNQPDSEPITDERCITSPWSRSNDTNLCPYALFWRHWGLAGYEPISE